MDTLAYKGEDLFISKGVGSEAFKLSLHSLQNRSIFKSSVVTQDRITR